MTNRLMYSKDMSKKEKIKQLLAQLEDNLKGSELWSEEEISEEKLSSPSLARILLKSRANPCISMDCTFIP